MNVLRPLVALWVLSFWSAPGTAVNHEVPVAEPEKAETAEKK